MANRGKGETSKASRSKSNLPEHEQDANANLLLQIKQMMDEMRTDIIGNFNSIVSEVVKRELKIAFEPFERKLAAHGTTIADLERSANDQSTRMAELKANVDSLTAVVASLERKCEDLESRSRWNNVRIVGVPEGSEGPRPTEFTADFLKDLLGLDEKPVLDRAHRTLRSRPKDGDPPRPLIVRVNLFQTRNIILRRASEMSPLAYKGRRISIFPDFTPAVAKKRAAFAKVKKELHSCPNVKFGLLYPATLRISLPGGQTHRFDDASSAMDFVVQHIKKG